MSHTVNVNGQPFSIDTTVATCADLKRLCGVADDHRLSQLADDKLQMLPESKVVEISEGAQFFAVPSSEARTQKIDFSRITSLIALVISIISLSYSYISSRESSASDAVKTSYSIFLDMSKMQQQNSKVMHVFALSNVYPEVARRVHAATKDLSDAEKNQLILAERSLADYIFTTFEYSLYEHKVAEQFHDTAKAKFLQEVLDYFTTRQLRNPRLLYYWNRDGGGLSVEYEDWTNKYYDEHVLHDKNQPLVETPDPTGPIH